MPNPYKSISPALYKSEITLLWIQNGYLMSCLKCPNISSSSDFQEPCYWLIKLDQSMHCKILLYHGSYIVQKRIENGFTHWNIPFLNWFNKNFFQPELLHHNAAIHVSQWHTAESSHAQWSCAHDSETYNVTIMGNSLSRDFINLNSIDKLISLLHTGTHCIRYWGLDPSLDVKAYSVRLREIRHGSAPGLSGWLTRNNTGFTV